MTYDERPQVLICADHFRSSLTHPSEKLAPVDDLGCSEMTQAPHQTPPRRLLSGREPKSPSRNMTRRAVVAR